MKNIRIDGVIGKGVGEVSAASVRSELPANGTDPVRVSIHSEGGSVFEGFAIYDEIVKYAGPKTIAVESTAFSIASFIAMAGDDIEMSPNAYFMLHNPRISIEGDDVELAKNAAMIADLKENMVSAYASRTGKTPNEINAILKDETYFNATDAVAFGLADRVTQKPIHGRAVARLDSMPHGVVLALFGTGSGGDDDFEKGQTMSESTPVAATVREIRLAYPKAKADFVLACLEKAMPMASVASAAAEEMMSENEELKKQVTAMTDEIASMKAKAMDDDEEDAEAEAEFDDDEDEKVKAKAKARGVRAVAKSKTSGPSASASWDSAVDAATLKTNGNKFKGVALANRQNPGLRASMLAEVNGS